jgi:hypothetical protein
VPKHQVDHQRQHQQGGKRRERGPPEQEVEAAVQRHRRQQAWQQQLQTAVRAALVERDRDHCQHRRRAAMHDRGAEAPDDLHRQRGLRARSEVVQVLDEREAGADREAGDSGVHRQPDAPRANQEDDQHRLQGLLDPRRQVARIRREIPREIRVRPVVEQVARAGCEAAGRNHRQHHLQPQQLVGITLHQRGEKQQHRHECDRCAQQQIDVQRVARVQCPLFTAPAATT